MAAGITSVKPEIDPRAAVLYARVSSKEQELGYSISAKQDRARPYAAKQSLVIRQEFLDVEMAKTPGQPGFNAMVAYLKEHRECRVVLPTLNLAHEKKDLSPGNGRSRVPVGAHSPSGRRIYSEQTTLQFYGYRVN